MKEADEEKTADKILGEEINLKIHLSPPQRTIIVNAMLKFKSHYDRKNNRDTSLEGRRE